MTQRQADYIAQNDVEEELVEENEYPFVRNLSLRANHCGDNSTAAAAAAAAADIDATVLSKNFPLLKYLSIEGRLGLGAQMKLSLLSKEQLSSFSRLQYLQSLALKQVHFSDRNLRGLTLVIPKIRNLTCLEVIDPALFALSDRAADKFLKSVTRATSLVRLVLRGCRLHDGRIKTFANELQSNSRIQYLDIARNQIRALGLKELAKPLLKKATSLAHLDLSGNNLTGGEYTLAYFLKSPLCRLESLVLRQVSFRSDELRILMESVASSTSLRRIDVAGNQFALPLIIFKTIQSNHNLTDICIDHISDFSSNTWDPQYLNSLTATLRENKNLERFSVAELSLPMDDQVTVLQEQIDLANEIVAHQSLRELCLWSFPIYINAMILRSSSLRCIRISRMQWFESATSITFGQVLEENKTLIELDIHGCYFGGSKRRSHGLFEGLARNTSLRKLCLADNGFAGEELDKLVDSMEKNTSITSLDISGNRIPLFIVARRVASLIRESTSLRELSICSCGIGNRGYEAIARSLRSNRALVKLDMSWNGQLVPRMAHEFGEALARNISLRSLIIQCNQSAFNISAAETLRKAAIKRGNIEIVYISAPCVTER